jgi:molybdate transport system substrate-binding protein
MRRMTKRLFVATLAVGSVLAPGGRAASDPERAITLAAAASLRSVLPDLVKAFQDAQGRPAIQVSYGASDALRAQVEAGAPVDAVLFAAPKDVDSLIEKGLADRATRRVIATNRLVLVGPRDGPAVSFATLTSLPADARIAIGDPRSVPAGRYAKQALDALGSWDTLAPRFVLGADVSGVLAIVRRGEASAGIVYETDARGIAEVRVLDRAAGSWAPRVELVAAVVAGAAAADGARRFLDFIVSQRGRAAFAERGFGPPPDATP